MKRILIIAFTLLSLSSYAQLPSVKPGSTEFRFPNTGNTVDTFATKADVRAAGGTGATLYSGTGSNTDGAINQAANTALLGAKPDTSSITQTADYVIEKVGSTIYARPGYKSGLPAYSGSDAYTVIQAAIDRLTQTGGGIGSAGGRIHIKRGVYSLSNELHIVGWEGAGYAGDGPYSQLIIDGDGFSTQIGQSTSGKNGLVISNAASVVLKNFKITTSGSARSCILADTTGTDQEASMYRSSFDNIWCFNNSATYPAIYLRDFILCNFGWIEATNVGGDGMILENASNTHNLLYGNSTFAFVHTKASTTYPFAGLKIQTAQGTTANMNLLTFQNYETTSGYYGLYMKGATNCSFNFVDIESPHVCIFLDTSASYNNFNSGYLLANGTDTAISIAYAGGSVSGNNFKGIFLQVASTVTSISDLSNYNRPNSFDITQGSSSSPINIANKLNTPLRVKGLGTITGTEYLQRKTRKVLSDATYTIGYDDYLISYSSLTATRAVTLGNANKYGGQHFVIKDESGNASSTIKISLIGTVQGVTNPDAITTPYGVYKFYSNGTSWFTE